MLKYNSKKSLDKVVCDCGAEIKIASWATHLGTDKHKSLIERIKNLKLQQQKEESEKLDPELTEISELTSEENENPKLKVYPHRDRKSNLPLQPKPKPEPTMEEEIIHEKSKCDKCGFASSNKTIYRSHYVSNKHVFSKYKFDDDE